MSYEKGWKWKSSNLIYWTPFTHTVVDKLSVQWSRWPLLLCMLSIQWSRCPLLLCMTHFAFFGQKWKPKGTLFLQLLLLILALWLHFLVPLHCFFHFRHNKFFFSDVKANWNKKLGGKRENIVHEDNPTCTSPFIDFFETKTPLEIIQCIFPTFHLITSSSNGTSTDERSEDYRLIILS